MGVETESSLLCKAGLNRQLVGTVEDTKGTEEFLVPLSPYLLTKHSSMYKRLVWSLAYRCLVNLNVSKGLFFKSFLIKYAKFQSKF